MAPANMEPYQRSVQSVDAALNRLKATLASYKLSEAKSGTASNGAHKETSRGSVQSAASHHSQAIHKANSTVPAVQRSVSANTTTLVQQQSAAPNDSVWREVLALRAGYAIPQITKAEIKSVLAEVKHTYDLLEQRPYCLPLYIILAKKQLQLGYPDLAACAAYKALLLSDSVQDQADEYHEEACDALREVVLQQSVHERISLLKGELHGEGSAGPGVEHDVEVDLWLRKHYEQVIYELLWQSLFLCGCYKTAHSYAAKGLRLFPMPPFFQDAITVTKLKIAQLRNVTYVEVTDSHPPSTWPDSGYVRREHYPWNLHEPNRYKDLDALNAMMAEVAPKLEIRAVELPALNDKTSDVVTQLGVFAKEDIAPGEAILQETSMLTANNKLQDALCDACSTDLPPLDSESAQSTVSCPDCEVVFCSQQCFDAAMAEYHPALCDRDVEAIAKDVPPAEAADSLYALLLLRTLAMAETQNVHPLDLPAVKYIWGDFTPNHIVAREFRPPTTDPWNTTNPVAHNLPRTLPFSFEANVRLPLHMLEKMDVDVFTAGPRYDGWVFNTLYAKFRGTASARLSGLGGRAIRGPEVSAVHPLWCMANHSCDPNVSWEWGGSVKFWAREQRVAWAMEGGEGGNGVRSLPGLRKGDEVLNHYCDVELGVRERREWARGSLGGDCMCTRCVYEARELERAERKK